MPSALTLDAGGQVTAAIRHALEANGALFVTNSGLRTVDDVAAHLELLGFGAHTRFELGGRTSQRVQDQWVRPGLRRMDHYPPHLTLLPNNEVQYRRVSPRWVLLAVLSPPAAGGQIFLHDARELEAHLPPALVARLDRLGLRIETGFLDANDPAKSQNYFQSWQERFGTDDPLRHARAETDEYDEVWWQGTTLMTRITLPARWTPGGPLRFPRLAADGPAPHNGFRRFPFGDGSDWSAEEKQALRDAFEQTRQSIPLEPGMLILFDNTRFAHSRAPFTGPRDLVVGMAGRSDEIEPPSRRPLEHRALNGPVRYRALPDRSARATRVLDLQGTFDAPQIRGELARFGAVHVRNTGLRLDAAGSLSAATLAALGFGPDELFQWGGTTCGRTEREALSRELRATDKYPKHLWLLPHNEVLYQRTVPQRLLFVSARDCDGRTFVHSAQRLQAHLSTRGEGRTLLQELRVHGLRIEMGFIDQRHPQRGSNFFRSWQERFDTANREEAERRCRLATHQFDDCWWRDEDGFSTLMTRIRVPAFHGETLLFPRIALNGPALENGFRSYPLGNGRELTNLEVDLLLDAFLETLEGVPWRAGDLLLVDNIRYGHSREAFEGPRELGVAMAGSVTIGPWS